MKRKLLTSAKIKEVSSVDRGGNQHAAIVLWKSAGEAVVQQVLKSFDEPKEDFLAALADVMQVEDHMETREKLWPLLEALRESVVETATNYEGAERTAKIREQVEDFMTAMRAKLSDDGPAAGSPGEPTSTLKEGRMDLKELEKKLGDLEAQYKALETAVTDSGLKLEKSGEGKEATFKVENPAAVERDALTKALEEAEIKVTKADDGAVAIEKAAPPETVEIDGEVVAKGDVPEAVFKSLKAQADRIAKLESDRDAEAIAKRAEEELPNLAGEPLHKGALLKAVEAMPEKQRDEVMKSLKAADAAVKASFDSVGVSKGGADDPDSVAGKLEAMAKSLVEKGEAKDLVQARAQVAKSKEGRELRASANNTAH